MNKIIIVHYQQLEKYPPVMNFINTIDEMNSVKSEVFTTFIKNGIWFSKKNTTIHRFSKQHTTSLGRYWGYLKINYLLSLSTEQANQYREYARQACVKNKHSYKDRAHQVLAELEHL